jgi:plastocyanin
MQRFTRPRRLVRVALSGVVAAGLVAATGGIAFGDIQRVKAVDGNKFKPKHAYIFKGDKIRWKNKDNIVHNVKAIDLSKDWNYKATIDPGETASRKFKNVGNYQYRCTLHSTVGGGTCSGMCGIIHVSKQ